MSFLTKLFGRRPQSDGETTIADGTAARTKEKPSGADGLNLKKWSTILVPAFELPFSKRSLAVASRLAKESGASVILAYMIEVPRALALDANQPEEESIAESVLSTGAAVVKSFHVPVSTTVIPTRNVRDGIRKLIKDQNIDLLILGRRHDTVRGLSRDLAIDLFRDVPCEAIIDYIGDITKS